MALTFHPHPGTILMCSFPSDFKPPEMVKRRPVLVVSPNLKRHSGLCTVVALSTQEPSPIENWHYKLPRSSMPPSSYFQKSETWIKGDMLYRISFKRLELIKIGKDPSGNRIYFKDRLSRQQMKDVYSCILHSLNLGHIAQHI